MIIRKLRQERGWSQEDLAEMSGLSVRTIQRIENGGRASLETLKCLAAVFETSIPELRRESEMSDERPESGSDGPVELQEPRRSSGRCDCLSEEDRAALRYVRNLMRYDDWSDDWHDEWDDDDPPDLPPEERIRRQVRRERRFYRHLAAYVVTIAFLAFINLMTSPDYLWFLWALGGWGFAIALQATKVFGRNRLFGEDWERREVERRLQRLAGHGGGHGGGRESR